MLVPTSSMWSLTVPSLELHPWCNLQPPNRLHQMVSAHNFFNTQQSFQWLRTSTENPDLGPIKPGRRLHNLTKITELELLKQSLFIHYILMYGLLITLDVLGPEWPFPHETVFIASVPGGSIWRRLPTIIYSAHSPSSLCTSLVVALDLALHAAQSISCYTKHPHRHTRPSIHYFTLAYAQITHAQSEWPHVWFSTALGWPSTYTVLQSLAYLWHYRHPSATAA